MNIYSVFFHEKGNRNKNIFYEVGGIVNIPVIILLFLGKTVCIYPQKQCTRHINKKRSNYPEPVRFINHNNLRGIKLIKQKENRKNDY